MIELLKLDIVQFILWVLIGSGLYVAYCKYPVRNQLFRDWFRLIFWVLGWPLILFLVLCEKVRIFLEGESPIEEKDNIHF